MKKKRNNFIDLRTSVYSQALLDVINSDSTEYVYRRDCRKYSSLFKTPLGEVFKLPYAKVLQNLYENHFESLADQEDGEEALIHLAEKLLGPEVDPAEEALMRQVLDQFKQLQSKKTKANEEDKPMPPLPPEQAESALDGLQALADLSELPLA